MKIKKTIEFHEWFKQETAKSQTQIAARLKNIEDYGHFGECRHLGLDLAELKWKNGRRIYFTLYKEGDSVMLLLLGGYKNAQDEDIKKARRLLQKYKA